MNKLTSIAFAAGLSLSPSACRTPNPMDECQRILPTEERLLMLNGTRSECDEIWDEEARNHCSKMVAETRSKALSACMTRQKKQPVLCNYQNGVWDCKSMSQKNSKDKLTWIFK